MGIEKINIPCGIELENENNAYKEIKKIDRAVPKEFFDNPSNKFLYDNAVSELSREGLSPETEKFINEYLDILAADPEKEDPDDDQGKYEQHVDKEKTGLLISKLDEFLVKRREDLGIPPGEEKPFNVKVLGLKGEDYYEQEEEWEKITSRPSMFMYRDTTADNDIKNSTLYLSSRHLEKMISDDGWEEFWRAEFCHEYRHSQRSFSYGNSRLYRFIDEICTNITGYIEITTVLDVLCSSTKGLKIKDFFEAYESDNNDLKSECLQKFKENFGSFGLMLLGGKKSSEHSGDGDGIKDLPYIKKYENEDLSFFETMLAILEERTQGNWLAILSDNIKNSEKFSREKLEIVRKHVYIYCGGTDDADAVFAKKVFDLLDKEIEVRKSKNEKGWGE